MQTEIHSEPAERAEHGAHELPRALKRQSTPGGESSAWAAGAALRSLAFVMSLILSLAAPSAFADDVVVQERDVSGFTGIVFAGTGDLHITQSDSESMTITAEQKVLDVITTEVKGGVLHIGRKRGSKVRSREEIRFDVSLRVLERLGMSGSGDAFAERLESEKLTVTISGSSDVELGEVLTDELRVTISGSGELELDQLDASHVDASITGSGEIEISGRTDTQDVSVAGSGDHKAMGLESRSANATVVGSGAVEIWAVESLDVTVTGSGDVVYKGSPEVSLQVTGSGSVKAEKGLF